MATLVSPGVSVTVIDESISVGAGEGTVPLILISTAQDKPTPDGSSTAVGTTLATANSLYLITSQRELLQTYGDPIFQNVGGNQINGSPLNEYGLLAAHSYLGSSNRVYVLRSDINLTELDATVTEPTSALPAGTVWFDTALTNFGLFYIKDAGDAATATWTSLDIGEIYSGVDMALALPSAIGLYAASFDPAGGTDLGTIGYYVSTSLIAGGWVKLETVADYQAGSVYPTLNSVAGALVAGDFWTNTSASFSPLNIVLSVLSAETGLYVLQSVPVSVTDPATASTGDFYMQYQLATADFELRRYNGAAWAAYNTFQVSNTEPLTGPTDGVYWYNPDLGLDGTGLSTVDLMIKGSGNSWEDTNLPGFTVTPGQKNVYEQATDPVTTVVLVDGDIWIDTDQVNAYPVISRWRASEARWILVNNADQTTNNGIVFADARPEPEYVRNPVIVGDYNGGGVDLDIDTPDPDAYPEGFLLWNTRYSTRNVKQWDASHEVGLDINNNPVLEGRWVNASGNFADGSPKMGTEAQRAIVTESVQAAIVSNEDIRSEFLFFNLIACPGYPETLDEMVALNVDRKETAFVVGDTPFTLKASATALQAYATNAANATGNGQDAIITADPYVGVYYPSGLATNIDGNDVVVPPSHMMLRTIAYSDQVSYPWFAPAGLTRGRIDNASAVGYVNDEGEFVPVTLNQGQRDTLYVNNINPIAFVPNQGLSAMGQKTRNPIDSALSRINVARLVNYIRYQSEVLARPFLFEPNDSQTRDNAKDAFDRFLAELVTLRGLTDFLVVCDNSNNTPARIDRNELWIDIAIIPTKAIEFIYIPIRIRNTGADLTTV